MAERIDVPRSRTRNQNKKNKKKSKKQSLTETEKKLLEAKVKQVEQDHSASHSQSQSQSQSTSESTNNINNPSTIFNQLKNEPRWSQHKPDILIKAIKHYMKNPESSKKCNKNKNKNKNNSTSDDNNKNLIAATNSNNINNDNHNNKITTNNNDNNNNNTTSNSNNTNNSNNRFPSYKIIDYSKKNNSNVNKKRRFDEMMNGGNRNNNNKNKNNNNNAIVTEYVDSAEARRTTRDGFEQTIKDALMAKRRRTNYRNPLLKHKSRNNKKSGNNGNEMTNSIILDNSDPAIVQGSKNGGNNNSWQIEYPTQTLSDVGGITKELGEKLDTLLLSMSCKKLWNCMGSTPPRSVLLHGPPGSGKTLLAHALAGEAGIGFIKVSAPELIAGVSGQSEAKIRSLFETALNNEPCMVFIDEIDVIASKRENASKEMEKRIVAQLLTCLDDIARHAVVSGNKNREMSQESSSSSVASDNNNNNNNGNDTSQIHNLMTKNNTITENGNNVHNGTNTSDVKMNDNETTIEGGGDGDIDMNNKNENENDNDNDNDNNDNEDNESELSDFDVNSDDLNQVNESKCVMFIAATNRPDSIDPALRRGDRFDSEIFMGMPNEDARLAILKILTKNMKLCENFDYNKIAKETSGYVGADLKTLTKEAGVSGVKRILKDLGHESETHINEILFKHHTSNINIDNKNENKQETNSKDDNNNNDNHCKTANDNDNNDNNERDNIYSSLKRIFERKENEGHNRWVSPNYDNLDFSNKILSKYSINTQDFLNALKFVEPSSRREGFATKPDVQWNNVGSLNDVKKELEYEIEGRIRNPLAYKWFGMSNASGILLYGPPGCGKTLLAKAVASHSGASFISIKGPELLNKYVGESERAVRVLFDRARSSQPCIIFFDELDALAPKRDGIGGDGEGNSGNNVTQRVVNQLLTEMDGISDRGRIFVIGATNRVDIIDPALMRPGRLGKLMYVSLPDAQGRYEILKAHCKDRPLKNDINLKSIANNEKCERFTGADLHNLVERACMEAIKQYTQVKHENNGNDNSKMENDDSNNININETNMIDEMKNWFVEAKHFEMALNYVKPSVTERQSIMYDRMAEEIKSSQLVG